MERIQEEHLGVAEKENIYGLFGTILEKGWKSWKQERLSQRKGTKVSGLS
jgi:hypothetical protein